MGIFSSLDVAPEQAPIFKGEPVTVSSPYSEEQTNTTATLAALAQRRNQQSEETFQSTIDQMKQIIDGGGEQGVRDGISQTVQDQKVQQLRAQQAAVLSGTTLPLTVSQLVSQEIDTSNSAPDPNALEKEGIAAIQDGAAHDPHQAASMLNSISQGDILDRSRDNLTKLTIFNREVDKLQQEVSGQGIGRNILDFLTVPFQSIFTQERSGLGSALQTPGGNLQETVQKLWSLPVDEFASKLPGIVDKIRNNSGLVMENRNLALQTLESFRKGDFMDRMGSNFWAANDLAQVGVFIPFSRLAKLVKSPSQMLMALGDRSANTKLTTAAIAKDISGAPTNTGGVGNILGETGAIEESLPAAVLPEGRPYIGVMGEVQSAYEGMIRSVNESMADLPTVARQDPAQLQAAVDKKMKEIQNEFKNDNVVDFNQQGPVQISEEPETGLLSTSVYLGRKSGSGGYLTLENAQAAAERRGLSLQDVEIVENQGQHFIKVTQHVPETGVLTPVHESNNLKGVGWWAEKLKDPLGLIPEDFGGDILTATNAKARVLDEVMRPLVKVMQGAAGSGRKHLQTVFDMGKNQGKWFNPTELSAEFERVAGRPPTVKEMKAYFAGRVTNDLDYHLRNTQAYINEARKGTVTVSAKNDDIGFALGRTNGRVIESPDDELLAKGHVFDVENGVTEQNVTILKSKLASGNYRLIELQSPHKYGEQSAPIKNLLVHKRSSTVGPLERQQINYSAGGHREYAGKYYVKQTVSGEMMDGTKYLMNPLTHINTATAPRAQKWADQMNRALDAWNSFKKGEISETTAREIIEGSPVENFDKFAEQIEKGEIRSNHQFEVLFDRAMPKEYRDINYEGLKWYDPDMPSTQQKYISQGRMYYSPKGDHLPDETGALAKVVDPFRTMAKGLENAIQTRMFGDYNTKVIEEWSRMALDANAIEPKSIGGNTSPVNVFFNGKIGNGIWADNYRAAQALENYRNIHKRLLNYKTESMNNAELRTRRFATWLESQGQLGDMAAARAYDVASSNPIQVARGMVFDMYLGLGNLKNLWLQSQTAVAAIIVHPKYGIEAAGMYPIVRMLMWNRSDNVLDWVAKFGNQVHGFYSPEEFKFMIKKLRASGWMNVANNFAEMGQFSNKIGGSIVGRAWAKTRELGRIPFNEAEKINRIVAYQIAWKKLRDAGMDITTTDFERALNKETNELAMNMSSANKSAWQTGVWSVPTQFLPYQARMLEKMLPKVFGGSKSLSAAQRSRLILGQMGLYGAAGAPTLGVGLSVFNWAADQYESATGQKLSPEMYRAGSKGAWDSLLSWASGGQLETDLASQAGQDAAWAQFWQKIGSGETTSILEALVGPTGDMIGNFANGVNKLLRFHAAEQLWNLNTEEYNLVFEDVMKSISTLNHAQQAYWIWKTGFLRDEKTGRPIVEANKLQAVGVALGIPMAQQNEYYHYLQTESQTDDFAKKVAEPIIKARHDAYLAVEDHTTEGDRKAEAANKFISGYMQIWRDDQFMQNRILGFVNQGSMRSQTEFNQLKMRMLKDSGTAPRSGN